MRSGRETFLDLFVEQGQTSVSCVANKCYFIQLDLQLGNLIQGLSQSQCNSYNIFLRCKANYDRLFETCTFRDLFIKL